MFKHPLPLTEKSLIVSFFHFLDLFKIVTLPSARFAFPIVKSVFQSVLKSV